MSSARRLIVRHPLAAYFGLTFAISWGGFVAVVGPGAFPGTGTQFDARMPYVVTAMLAGPSLAAFLVAAAVSGRRGLDELRVRLLTWRVGWRWYAAALLPAPLIAAGMLLAQSLPFPVAGPDGAAVLTGGLIAGLLIVFEEIGWTGVALPRLRTGRGALHAALVLGAVWGFWHLLQGLWVAGAYAGETPLPRFIVLNFLGGAAQLMAYRVLMVWVYDRTQSLLLATLMHGSLTASGVFLFTPMATGARLLEAIWWSAAAWWAVVAVVGLLKGRHA